MMPGLGQVYGHGGSVASGSSGKLSGLFSGGPTPSPRPVHPLALGSSQPAPCQGQPEARGWKQGCGSPHTFDGRSPCPAPQHSLILIHPLFHVRHGLLFPLQRETERQSRWAEGQPLISVGSPEPAIPQLHRALSCRDALSAGPGCRLLSLLQPGLFPGSSSATGRNPQGQPMPGAKLGAHGHGERLLHEVLPVNHSEPPWGKHRGRSMASGPVEAGGKPEGHATPEPPRAAVLVAAQTHTGKRPGAHPHIRSHTHSTQQTHTNTHNIRHTPDTRPTEAKWKGAHPHTCAYTRSTQQTLVTPDPRHMGTLS